MSSPRDDLRSGPGDRVRAPALPAAPDLSASLEPILPGLLELYRELHAAPELSREEERTAGRLAAELERLGFAVTRGVGGHGVVGLLARGRGPVVLVRTDMDALPVLEETDLPYRSRAVAIDADGRAVPVMHACGHDVHMAAWSGAAALLSGAAAGAWNGTLVFVGQPAEERGSGARALLADGLLERFPRPDAALALHASPELPTGTVGVTPGWAFANVDSVEVVVRGRGGHGAYPHVTVDPVVIGARIVTALQTLVSRETDPRAPAVVTVGAFLAGTTYNVIPDEARLLLTVRSFDEEVRRRLLDGIRRVASGEAAAAGAPAPPEVSLAEGTAAVFNDPALAARVAAALRVGLGGASVEETPPVLAGEDFGELARAGIPSVLFWCGTVEPAVLEDARRSGRPLPGLHSPRYAPEPAGSVRTGALALALAALELLGRR